MFASFDLRQLMRPEEAMGAAQLRLFVQEDLPQDPAGSRAASAWTVREFVDSWFRPNHVKAKKIQDEYEPSILLWEQVTINPPITAVDQTTATAAVTALETIVSAKTGKPLSAGYRAKVVRHWDTIFRHAGPRFGRRGAYANLIAEPPWFEFVATAEEEELDEPKGTWEYSEARAIADAASRMCRPCVSSTAAWWRLALATLYYLGIRDGQLLELQHKHVVIGSDCWRLIVKRVQKTGKRLIRRLPDDWIEVYKTLHPIEARRDPEGLILPWPLATRGRVRQLALSTRQSTLIRLHGSKSQTTRARKLTKPQRTLQDLAGLPLERHFEVHGWRRLHDQMYVASGAKELEEGSQATLQHSDRSVTAGHYYDAAEMTPILIARKFPLF